MIPKVAGNHKKMRAYRLSRVHDNTNDINEQRSSSNNKEDIKK
jgi:hypothetical protein